MSITIIIIAITAIISFMAFSNRDLMEKLIFYPPDIDKRNQWYRFFTNGIIHADIAHLAFNMISLYFFGPYVEGYFGQIFPATGKLLYIILYISSLAICLVPTYMQHKENYYYRSLGASGAVSAIIFSIIMLDPEVGIAPLGLINIPGFIFGPLFLIGSAYMSKRGDSHINHSAHLWGALYGVVFTVVMCFALSHFNPLTNFVDALQNFFQQKFSR